MCELLGMSFNKEVTCSFSFHGFRKRGTVNPDGWGIALYPENGKAVQVFKEPIMANKSELSGFLKQYSRLQSHIFISHVRYATSEISYKNTHPFVRELDGREYVFAHNGVLRDYRKYLSLGRWKPLGTTDSEYAFCHLLYTLGESHERDNDSFLELENEMRRINQLGTFNCLLSEGEYLYCFRDGTGYYKGLCYTHRKPPYDFDVSLRDDDFEVRLQDIKNPNETGFIIATKPLTRERWNDIKPGALIVFHKGKQVFPKKEFIIDEDMLLQTLNIIRSSLNRISVESIMNNLKIEIGDAHKVLQPLIDKGYIMQDGRDQGIKFDPSSTYYTVPNKRNKIEKMLSDDSYF